VSFISQYTVRKFADMFSKKVSCELRLLNLKLFNHKNIVFNFKQFCDSSVEVLLNPHKRNKLDLTNFVIIQNQLTGNPN